MNEKMFEKIEQYLTGEMSPNEQKQFESELDSNEELASALAVYRAIENKAPIYAAQQEKEAALKNSIEKLNAAFFYDTDIAPASEKQKKDIYTAISTEKGSPPKTNAIAMWKWMLAAACLAGIIVVSVIWYSQQEKEKTEVAVKKDVTDTLQNKNQSAVQNPPDHISSNNNKLDTSVIKSAEKIKNHTADDARNKALYAANFKPDAAPENTAGPLQEAFEYYKSEDYDQAAASIDNADITLATRAEQTDTALATFYADYYKALCTMATNKFSHAIPLLNKAITNSPDSSFKTKAQWYLALAYLHTGDKEKTETLLQQIANVKSSYQSKAAKLLVDLRAQ